MTKHQYYITKKEAINKASFIMHIAYEEGHRENYVMQEGIKEIICVFATNGLSLNICRPSHYKVIQTLTKISNYVACDDCTLDKAYTLIRRKANSY